MGVTNSLIGSIAKGLLVAVSAPVRYDTSL